MILKSFTFAKFTRLFLVGFIVSPFIFKAQNTIPSTTVTGCLKVDSTMSTSNLQSTGNLSVDGIIQADSSVVVNDSLSAQNLRVTGSARVAGDIQVGGSLLFKNGSGISVTNGTTPGSEIYSYGKTGVGTSPPLNTCLNPNPPFVTHQFGNAIQIFDNGTSGYTGGNILTMQSWFNGSSIDVAGAGGLLMNYFCGKDIAICTGSLGGTIYAGDKFRSAKNIQIGPHWQNLDPSVALDVYMPAGVGLTDGIKLWPASNTSKIINTNNGQFVVLGDGSTTIRTQNSSSALHVFDVTNNKSAFVVKSNGQLEIGGSSNLIQKPMVNISNVVNDQIGLIVTSNQLSNGINNANVRLNVNRNDTRAIELQNLTPGATQPVPFVVLGNGKTCIGCNNSGSFMLAVEGTMGAREIKVTTVTPWPDYVFEKEYKLSSLEQIEKYVNENKHLPGIPAAKDLQKEDFGLNIAEMQSLQMEKIENIYLYLIELKKEIEVLKKENQKLQNKLND